MATIEPIPSACERRRLSAGERRSEILRAARCVFAQHGFHGAGTSQIAHEAGCSEPMLYRHFSSKQALFAAALLDAQSDMHERMAELLCDADDPLERLATIADTLPADPIVIEITRLRMLAITLAHEPEVREALDQNIGHVRRRITEMATELQRDGRIRADVDPAQFAWLWIGTMFALGVRLAVEGESSAAEYPETLRTLLRVVRTEDAA